MLRVTRATQLGSGMSHAPSRVAPSLALPLHTHASIRSISNGERRAPNRDKVRQVGLGSRDNVRCAVCTKHLKSVVLCPALPTAALAERHCSTGDRPTESQLDLIEPLNDNSTSDNEPFMPIAHLCTAITFTPLNRTPQSSSGCEPNFAPIASFSAQNYQPTK